MGSCGACVPLDSTRGTIAHTAQDRLRGVFRATAGGPVAYRYEAATLLTCLQLSAMVKPSINMEQVVLKSSELTLGTEGRVICQRPEVKKALSVFLHCGIQ